MFYIKICLADSGYLEYLKWAINIERLKQSKGDQNYVEIPWLDVDLGTIIVLKHSFDLITD